MPKAYSYVRFSTPEQMKGDSLRRQMAKAVTYAQLNGLDLDLELTFQDLGTSAFRGKNNDDGRLAAFLEAVETGIVEQGSYLLVENLDRISRDSARRALRTLEGLVESGVTVVTLDDGRQYTSDGLDDMLSLIVALMTFVRANEESALKSKRLKASWDAKRTRARATPGAAVTSRCPAWLRYNQETERFELLEQRASIVRRIFDMLVAGAGPHKVAEILNSDGVPPFGNGRKSSYWHRSYIKKLSENLAVIGSFIPHETEWARASEGAGQRKSRRPTTAILDYFPAVVDAEVFNQVQLMRNDRRRAPSACAVLKNVLAGLAQCPRCGGTMTRVNKGTSAKAGRPYLICAKAKVGAGCEYVSVPIDLIFDHVKEEMETLILVRPTEDATLEEEIDLTGKAFLSKGKSMQSLLQAIEVHGSPLIVGRLAEVEEERDALKERLENLLERANATNLVVLDARLGRLREAVGEPEWDLPKVNALLRQVFQAVVVDYRAEEIRWVWKSGAITTLPYRCVIPCFGQRIWGRETTLRLIPALDTIQPETGLASK